MYSVHPVLSIAFPEYGPKAFTGTAVVDPARGGNPAWLSPGTLKCLQCNEYICNDRCASTELTQQRQSLAEYLSARRAARPSPTAQQAAAQLNAACELYKLSPLAAAHAAALTAYLDARRKSILKDGPAQLLQLLRESGAQLPWSTAPGSGRIHEAQLEEAATARLGRTLWRLTRCELADCVWEDIKFGLIWLNAAVVGCMPCAGVGTAALAPYLALYDAVMDAMSAEDAPVQRSACELAPLFAPEAEEDDSFGQLNWGYAENGTPWPTPRRGWFTLFARLPRRARAANAAVARRVATVLTRAGLVAQTRTATPAHATMFESGDVVMQCADAAGHLLCTVEVSDRWVPAPCAGAADRFGNFITLTWCYPEGALAAVRSVKAALKAAFAAQDEPAGEHAAGAMAGFGTTLLQHRVSLLSVAGRPDLTLEATCGDAPERPPPEYAAKLRGRDQPRGVATKYRLLQGGADGVELARCLVTYCNLDVGMLGPAIELFGVRRSHRGTGLGRVLHDAVVAELLSPVGWFPHDTRTGLQVSYVISGHAFFEKLGYLWAHELPDASSPQQLLDEALSGGVPTDTRNLVQLMTACNNRGQEDAVLPLHRMRACGACGATDRKLNVCSRCHCALFCDTKCQKAGWREHKQECRPRKAAVQPAPAAAAA